MRPSSLLVWLVSVWLAVFLVAGQTGLRAASSPEPAGEVVIGSSSEIVNPDPVYNTILNDVNVLYVNLYDALVVRRQDGSLGPQLAESWRQANPTTWEFRLRKGVKFQNGEPFNADAMKATIDRYLDGKGRSPFVARAISGSKVIDEYTIQLTTPKPDPILFENTIYWIYPIPPKYYGTVGDQGFAEKPIGTGPFKFVSWTKGNSLTLEANLDYWKGRPKFKRLVIRILPEIATRVAALRAGELDIAMEVPPDQIPVIEADPRLRISQTAVPRIVYLVTWSGGAGEGTQPLKDKRVRQALNYAINVRSIIQDLLGGRANRSATIIPPLAFGHDKSVAPYPYDPEKAKQLLAQAGYQDGFTVDLDVPNGGPYLKPVDVGQAIAADLSKVGIKARLRTVEAASYLSLRNEKKLAPIFLWNWFAYDGDLPAWGNAHPDFPFSFYNNPSVVTLINEERSTLDVRQRIAAFKKIQEILKDESPFVALYQQSAIFGVNKRIDWWAKAGGHVFVWDSKITGK